MKVAVICTTMLAMLLAFMTPAQAGNYDPTLPAPAPVLDAGWTSDAISSAWADSSDSPYVFSLSSPAYFRITDCCVVGDQFKVWNFTSLILTTSYMAGSPFGDNAYADAAWSSTSYQSGEVLLGPGSYELHVQGDGVGGLPAGFFTRLDTAVPLPGAASLGLAFLGGLGLVGAIRRRRRMR